MLGEAQLSQCILPQDLSALAPQGMETKSPSHPSHFIHGGLLFVSCRSQSGGSHSALEVPVSLNHPGDISPSPKAEPAAKVSQTSTTSTRKALSSEQVSGISTLTYYVSAW